MSEKSDRLEKKPREDVKPKVYSINQNEDGSFRFSRRHLLYVSAAVGGTVLIRGICPRFGTSPAASRAIHHRKTSLSKVYVHAEPSIASNITETLQNDDLVRLIYDHRDIGWVEIATRNDQLGWVERSRVDFANSIESNSPDFDFGSSPVSKHIRKQQRPRLNGKVHEGEVIQMHALLSNTAQSCGQVIQNGNFEAGIAGWVEDSPGYIIRDDWPDPQQGSYVAWFGGIDAVERLTQRFHIPNRVLDTQTLFFYLLVSTEETSSQVYDTFLLRFLDTNGSAVSNDIAIANNTTPTNWLEIQVDLTGVTSVADQDLQLQFEASVDSSMNSHFVLDSVSFDLVCDTNFYVYVPVIVSAPSTPTPIPPEPPCPSDCPSDCPSHCGSDCPSHCSSHCGSHCSSDCPLDCVYDCPFDCIYYCGWDCSYDCSYDWPW
jgi:uncharacterized protein YgiM (DUF1202 family)